MPSEHANLSPSSAEMWVSCPASIRMKREHASEITDEDSPYAREGTIAHGLAELTVGLFYGLISKVEYNREMKKWRAEFDAQGYAEGTLAEMEGHVRDFLEYVKVAKKRRPKSRIMLEQRMDSGIPQCWGTSDVVIVSTTHIEIIDFKYGQGVPVYAKENKQLRIYALGALNTFSDVIGEPDMVYASVFQPRINNADTEEVTPAELRRWRDEEILPRAELALSDDAPFGPSEKACRWCPVASICRVRVQTSITADFGEDFLDIPVEEAAVSIPGPEVLSPEELAKALERAPFISAWLASLEKYALDLAYSQGVKIPGYKVVRSGGTRYITDPAAAIQTLIDLGFKAEDVATFKIKGFGDLEKVFAKKTKTAAEGKRELNAKLDKYIAKTTGKESLVPESDNRTAITPDVEASIEFAIEDLI